MIAKLARRGRHAEEGCDHPSLVAVISSGFERVLCEDCGELSFSAKSVLSARPDRSRFMRRSLAGDDTSND